MSSTLTPSGEGAKRGQKKKGENREEPASPSKTRIPPRGIALDLSAGRVFQVKGGGKRKEEWGKKKGE